MHGHLPPSSSATGVRCLDAATITERAMRGLPVRRRARREENTAAQRVNIRFAQQQTQYVSVFPWRRAYR
jgi:hypothetical protein